MSEVDHTKLHTSLGDFLVFLRRVAISSTVKAVMCLPKWTKVLLAVIGCHKDTGTNTKISRLAIFLFVNEKKLNKILVMQYVHNVHLVISLKSGDTMDYAHSLSAGAVFLW